MPELVKDKDISEELKSHREEMLDVQEKINEGEYKIARVDRDDFTWSTEEIEMWRYKSSDECDRYANDKYGITFSTLHEKIAAHFWSYVFPFAKVFELGGGHKPDGLIILEKEQSKDKIYFIEEKFYGDGFRPNKERDKMKRYINEFKERKSVKGNTWELRGYIFVANTFKEDKVKQDIKDIEDYVDEGLDYILVDDDRMISTINSLSNLYRNKPSSKSRIYYYSNGYHRIFNEFDLEPTFENLDNRFGELVDKMIECGKKASKEEEKIEDLFGNRESFVD